MKKAPFLRKIGATQTNRVWSWCATMPDGGLLLLVWQRNWNKGRPLVHDPARDYSAKAGGRERHARLLEIGDGGSVTVVFCIEDEKAKSDESRIADVVEKLWPAKLAIDAEGRVYAELEGVAR